MKVHRIPDDDPGWYEADVWDCIECGVHKIADDCLDCPGCLAKQPEGSVYKGRCWGMKIVSNPTIKLTDLPLRSLIRAPRDQSLADLREIKDVDFFNAIRKFQGEEG